ncbi:DUF3137 domain-containing protein [Cyanobacteria bacterium FACHB-63]|nr:DUF3137 domain-containing protein [Cyanobacteria bacterium FACHB-63]
MADTELLQKGQAALNTGSYTEAIEFLEACCQQTSELQSQTYLKAQMGLVKAYHHTQQSEKAIALCQELAQNPNPKLQAWANQALQACSMSPQPEKTLLSAEEARSIFEQANKLMRLRRYEEAIPLLDKFCTQTDESYPNHYQARMLLVKAYQQHQDLEQAIALCQELLNVNHNTTQIWARNYLPMIAPEIAHSITEKSETQEEKDEGLPKRSLEEFKDFCRQNLTADLKDVEKTRKEVLLPLGIVTAIFVIVIGLALRFTPMMIDQKIASTQERCDAPVETVMRDENGKVIRPNVKVVDLEQLGRESSRRCKSDFIPRWARDGIKTLSPMLFVTGFAAFLWIAFYTSSTEAYGRGFQRNIIEKIINFLDPKQNLTYFRTGDDAVVLSALQQSRLFSGISQFVYLKQDHCVAGKIGQTNLFFSEIIVQKELPHTWLTSAYDFICELGRLSGSLLPISTTVFLLLSIVRGTPYCIGRIAKGQRIDFEHFRSEIVLNAVSRLPVFKGIFFISDFNRKFLGKTVILPNTLTSSLKFLNQHRGQSVKLEDPEFNKFFTVYSNDQVGARYVLSTSTMQRIVDFRKRANRDILISLVDNQLYIGVPSEEDLFEPRLFKTMLSFNPMREYFEILQLMMSIVEDLNLNQRIWKL